MCGYKTALCGALKQGAICQQAGATAAGAASQGAQNLGNLAKVGACIAATTQQLGIQGCLCPQQDGREPADHSAEPAVFPAE
jgi:hypothetical protein